MKKNMLTLTILSLLAMTITSCGDKNPSNNPSNGGFGTSDSGNSEPSTEPSWSFSQEPDDYGLIPDEILHSEEEISIDFFVYIQGQQGRINDIGNYSNDPNDKTRKYHPEDVSSIEMAKYFGAAQAFKRLAPNVKINLMYCSIPDYPTQIQNYKEQNEHLPHLMWGTEHVVEMFQNGYNYDLSRYENSQYYKQYNDYFMSRFNFGGFQAGFPIAAEPWGLFVNIDDLVDAGEITSVLNELGEPSDSYRAWVEDFTWERLVRTAEAMTTDDHSGMSKMVEYLTSYSVPSINEKFIREGKVDFTSDEVRPIIQKLLEYENRLAETTVYQYGADPFGISNNTPAKSKAPNAADWNGTVNFVKDQYSTFYGESPWAVGTISQKVKYYNTDNDPSNDISEHFDFLPYPKLDSDSPAYTGIAIEGLTVGNQCPVDPSGNKECSPKAQLEMDTAAYFAMFMGLDPRSIEARANINFIFNGEPYEGDVSFPLSKKGAHYSWQEPDFKAENPEIDDPAEEYDDNFYYQLATFFRVNDLYVTNDEGVTPDNVKYLDNVTPGLVKMIDSVYALDGVGEDDYVTCLNYWNEPVKVPDESADDTSGGDTTHTRDFFYNWQARFRSAVDDKETGAGALGTDTYVSNVLARLAEWEEDINNNAEMAWNYLQECVDSYYGSGRYNVLDRSKRNAFEGARPYSN